VVSRCGEPEPLRCGSAACAWGSHHRSSRSRDYGLAGPRGAALHPKWNRTRKPIRTRSPLADCRCAAGAERGAM